MPPKVFEGNDPISRLHRWLYPVHSKYYWYRQGKVSSSGLSGKYIRFALLSLVVAFAGSGSFMFACAMALTMLMQEWNSIVKSNESVLIPSLLDSGIQNFTSSPVFQNASDAAHRALNHDVSTGFIHEAIHDKVFMLSWMILAGMSTLVVYYQSASVLHNEFYVRQRKQAEEWKCQPNRWLSGNLELEERLSGCMNAFIAGFMGTGLFFYHQHRPILKLYYTTDMRGFVHYIAGCILIFFWVEFMSYWIHRLLHHKWIYKYIHKWHHRYLAPTAFGAFAMSPLEFLMFQSSAVICAMIFPVHIMSFLTVTVHVAYHNQVDHSGIYFNGDTPWMPSTKYHDDHHKYFHLNYGVQLVLWDWMFGTLRQSDRVYAEDIFTGEQDQPKKLN